MDDGALLALEAKVDMGIYGVDALVTQDAGLVLARAFWTALPVTDEVPTGLDSARRDLQRVLVLRRVGDQEGGVPLVLPVGTIIEAPLTATAVVQRWRVDGPARLDETYHYAVVVADPGQDT